MKLTIRKVVIFRYFHLLHYRHGKTRYLRKGLPRTLPAAGDQRKWGLLVILALEKKPLRFSELVHNIGGISERMASQTLKYLEQIGVVRREVLQRSKPPQVYYELTSLGRRFLKPLGELVETVSAHVDTMAYRRG